MIAMSAELYWLTVTAAMTSLFWLPYIFNRMYERGILKALWDPQGDTRADAAWADRMMRAHKNAIENLCVFAPLVLAVTLTGAGTALTAGAAMIYFFARLGHFVVFALGLPVIRVLCFVTGFGCQAVLVMRLLGWL